MGGHEAVGFCPVCHRKASMRKGKSDRRTKSPGRNGRFRMRCGMEEGCILPGITAGNALCLSLNRPRQGGIIKVKEGA